VWLLSLTFQQLMWEMKIADIKIYMLGLLQALCHTHHHNIVHRDVKPGNFLYNNKTKRGTLVDFGLAEDFKKKTFLLMKAVSSKTASTSSLRKCPGDNVDCLGELSPNSILDNLPEKRRKGEDQIVFSSSKPPGHSTVTHKVAIKKDDLIPPPPLRAIETCDCFEKYRVCSICMIRNRKTFSRAGTSGYRPPEVLMRCLDAHSGIDIWSAGVILLSLLCRRLSFFLPASDLKSIVQISRVFGTTKIQNVANKFGTTLTTSQKFDAVNLKELVVKFRKHNRTVRIKEVGNETKVSDLNAESEVDVESEVICKESKVKYQYSDEKITDDVVDLLSKLLDPDPITRITASSAIEHNFFK